MQRAWYRARGIERGMTPPHRCDARPGAAMRPGLVTSSQPDAAAQPPASTSIARARSMSFCVSPPESCVLSAMVTFV